jgi:two-component system, chemotaxis family, protein-glutamate methylesterase/glutaminase
MEQPTAARTAIPLVVAGASAGGVSALSEFVRGLPATFGGAALLVLHVSPDGTSVLPAILSRQTKMAVSFATDGQELKPGTVVCAPPDAHLVVDDSVVRLTKTPRKNGHRPAIDVTMLSAAEERGASVTGVVLSGTRDDGTAGLISIARAGGKTLVQDPEEALYSGMPSNALANAPVDAVLPAASMGGWIVEHQWPAVISGGAGEDADPADLDPRQGPRRTNDPPLERPPGEGTRFVCPDCGGVLFESDEFGVPTFICSVGHSFSIDSLSTAQDYSLEASLWSAIRALEDRVVMLERLAERARQSGGERSERHFRERARDLLAKAASIRQAVQRVGVLPVGED